MRKLVEIVGDPMIYFFVFEEGATIEDLVLDVEINPQSHNLLAYFNFPQIMRSSCILDFHLQKFDKKRYFFFPQLKYHARMRMEALKKGRLNSRNG